MNKYKIKKSIKQNLRNRMLNLKYKSIIKALLKSLKAKEITITSEIIAKKLETLSNLIKFLDKSWKKKIYHKNNIIRKKKLAYKIFADFLKKKNFH